MTDIQERCILKGDKEYPRFLGQIRNAPRQLYVRGQLPDENTPSVAVIGARSCSIYGQEMAEWFAAELAMAGVQIVSGMARGIDGIAQRAALAAGGRSYGVLGCGTDICYPKENKDLYGQLLEKGGILSEHPMGTPPLPAHFPSRNRIISGISDCVLVIEAKAKSGTLITADFALEQGKDVFALPGRLTDGLSAGCNRLICQGAGLALTPKDILESLYGKGWSIKSSTGEKSSALPEKADIHLNQQERLVWQLLDERGIGLQELYEKIKVSAEGKSMELPQVMNLLMELVMKEIILTEGGNKYRRKT